MQGNDSAHPKNRKERTMEVIRYESINSNREYIHVTTDNVGEMNKA